MKDKYPERMAASRQGFNKWNEYQRYKKTVGKPNGLSNKELRGPRYRYKGIEERRRRATEMMLEDTSLSYQDAMRQVTGRFMGTDDYATQRTRVTPAEQRRQADQK